MRKVLIIILLFLTACSEQKIEPLRIGTNIWPGYEPLYIAGKTSPELVQSVKFIEYRNASQVLNGIINNSIDVAALTLDEAVKIKSLGYDIQVVWLLDFSAGADALVSQPELGSIDDLKGARIGVETTALGAFIWARFLELNQLNETDYTVVNAEVNRQSALFQEKQIDAVITFDPIRTELLAFGAHTLFDSRDIDGEVVDVLVINKQTMTPEKQALLGSFLVSHSEIIRQINRDITPFYAALNARLKLNQNELASTYKLLVLPTLQQQSRWYANSERNKKLLTLYSDILVKTGAVDTQCECEDLLNLRYLQQITNEK